MTTQSIRKLTADDLAPELRSKFANVPHLPTSSIMLTSVAQFFIGFMRTVNTPGVSITPPKATPGVRIYTPKVRKSDGAMIWIHGGGYVLGAAKQDDYICGLVALQLGVVVLSVEYRIDHFPIPHDDCKFAWNWLQENASSLGVNPARVIIAGESAGGGLAAGLVQRLRDEGGVQPIGQVLCAPMIDDRTAARRELDAMNHFLWSNKNNLDGWSFYLNQKPGAADVPAYAVPARRTNLAGLPRTWIGVGSIDLFCEEDEVYAERLRADGVDAVFYCVPGGPHGVNLFKNELGREYERQMIAWMGKVLAE